MKTAEIIKKEQERQAIINDYTLDALNHIKWAVISFRKAYSLRNEEDQKKIAKQVVKAIIENLRRHFCVDSRIIFPLMVQELTKKQKSK